MAIIRLASLVLSYNLIFATLGSYLPEIVVSLTHIPYWDTIVKFLVAAVSTIRWIIGPPLFNFAMIAWLLLPGIKLIIYFNHKAASFGDLVGHAVQVGSK